MPNITSQTRISIPFTPAASEQNVLTAAKGSSIVFVGTLFSYAVRLVMGIVLARFLGPEQLGLYQLALISVTVAAGLALFGLRSALVRYVSLFASRRDMEGVWGGLQIGIGFPTAISVLLGIGMYMGADLIAERLFHEPMLIPLLRLASLTVPFFTLVDVVAAATRGFNKMQYAVIANDVSQPLIKLVLVIVLALTGLNAAKSLIAHILSVIVAFVLLLYFLNSLFSLKRPLRTARRDTREILSFALPIYLSYLIQTFRTNIQILLLGVLNTATTVGIFGVAAQVNQIGRMFHQSIVTVSMPIVSELCDRGEKKPLGFFYQTVTKWTFTLNLPLFLIVLLFSRPILSVFGKDFVAGATALSVLAWADLVDAGTGISGTILTMGGKSSLKLVNSIITSVLTLCLNALLIPRWGLLGAATAALITITVVNLLRLTAVFVLFRLLPYNLSFVKPVVAGLLALIIAWVIRETFHTEANLVYAAVNVLILFAVYGGIILLLGLSQEDRLVLARVGQRASTVLGRVP